MKPIPIIDISDSAATAIPPAALSKRAELRDGRNRPLHDLRISVTDRCNFRCEYCMPKDVFNKRFAFMPHDAMLNFEEIHRLARLFIARGVRKIRITGGEPLLRRHLYRLIEMLSCYDGIDIALTTNGVLLPKLIGPLKEAGLHRLTISLDALDDAVFQGMNNAGIPVSKVLDGLRAAEQAGFSPVKINMVVKRGTNDHQILPMVEHFRGTGHILRFIEFMDVGTHNGWNMESVVSSKEVVSLIDSRFPLEPADPNYTGEVARRWRFKDGAGEIGVISSVTEAFCTECSRIRLSTDGKLYTCLFANEGHDLRDLLRSGASNDQLDAALCSVWRAREERYSEIRVANTPRDGRIEMSYIGG